MTENYPIVTRIEDVAVATSGGKANTKNVSKFADIVQRELDAMKLSNADADVLFSRLENLDHMPDKGEIVRMARTLPSAVAGRSPDAEYVSVECPECEDWLQSLTAKEITAHAREFTQCPHCDAMQRVGAYHDLAATQLAKRKKICDTIYNIRYEHSYKNTTTTLQL